MKRGLLLLILSLTFSPSLAIGQSANSVDLLWQAETYVPAWYQGHSRPSSETVVEVIAVPHFLNNQGEELALRSLIFNWSKDGRDIASGSGLGRDSFRYISDSGTGSNTIKVTVAIPNTNTRVEESLTIATAAPSIQLYQEDPLAGILTQQSLAGEFKLTKPELTLTAEPFFFSADAVASRALDYEWRLNEELINTAESGGKHLTVAAPDTFPTSLGVAANNNISVAATNSLNPLQRALTKLNILFGQSNFNF